MNSDSFETEERFLFSYSTATFPKGALLLKWNYIALREKDIIDKIEYKTLTSQIHAPIETSFISHQLTKPFPQPTSFIFTEFVTCPPHLPQPLDLFPTDLHTFLGSLTFRPG